MTNAVRGAALILLLPLTACAATPVTPTSSTPTVTAPTQPSTPPASAPSTTTDASPAPSAKPTSATGWAKAVRQPQTTKIVTITEDNDPNDTIGRPGSYVDAAAIFDKRVHCQSKLDITCGAKIEMFSDPEEAKARAAYLDRVLKASPMLGSEWHELAGPVLLRVSGKLKPSWAKKYRQRFRAVADS